MLYGIVLLTTAALSYHNVRGLYFLAVAYVRSIHAEEELRKKERFKPDF